MGREGGYKQINKALNIGAFEGYLDSQLANLPILNDVEQISPLVLRILGQNAGKFTLQGTNTYIIGSGPNRLMIDTGQGVPEWAELVEAELDKAGISLSHVLLTHWHGDHTGGVPDILRMYPHLSSAIYKHTPAEGHQPITDGQVFKVEGATLRAIHAPGHSHDHMCFILEEENAMFTGDNVLGHGTAAIEILPTWMDSLRIMQTHQCRTGFPAHGEFISNLPAKITSELEVKERRESRVLETLQKIKSDSKTVTPSSKGSVSLEDLVTAMHGGKLDPGLREKAIEPFTDEVLRKLAGDGKVAFEVKAGKRKWFFIPPV